MADDLTAIPADQNKTRAKSFKRALDANLDGIPESKGIRKAIAKKGTAKPKKTAPIEGELIRQGAPSKYTPQIGRDICRMIADGKSLQHIEKQPDMPSRETIRRWLRDEMHEGFRVNYARAREEQADSYADQIADIAAETLKGNLDPLAARVATDNLKWIAGKRKPSVYGDKLDLTSDGKALPQPLFGGQSVAALPEPDDD